MRIIGGKHKGKSIFAPKNLPSRPTTDFAKEGLFNMLENEFDLEELTILDLFAGTGNLTYEFASRNVKSVACVEQNYNCVKFIRQTINELKLDNMSVYKNDVFKALKQVKQSFDLIIADPPYNLKNYTELIDTIISKPLITDNGILIIEHDKHNDFSSHPNFKKQKKYGNVNFSFFEIH